MPETFLLKLLPGLLVSKSVWAKDHPLISLKPTLSFLAEDLRLNYAPSS